MAKPDGAAAKARALDMLDFINASWTPYHAVEEASRRLAAAGFQHIAEKDAWDLQPGGWCGKRRLTKGHCEEDARGLAAVRLQGLAACCG